MSSFICMQMHIYMYKNIYIYMCVCVCVCVCVSLFVISMSRVFANCLEDLGSIPGRVIPKTFKMLLGTSLLNTYQYEVLSRVKWSNPGKGLAPSPTF